MSRDKNSLARWHIPRDRSALPGNPWRSFISLPPSIRIESRKPETKRQRRNKFSLFAIPSPFHLPSSLSRSLLLFISASSSSSIFPYKNPKRSKEYRYSLPWLTRPYSAPPDIFCTHLLRQDATPFASWWWRRLPFFLYRLWARRCEEGLGFLHVKSLLQVCKTDPFLPSPTTTCLRWHSKDGLLLPA